MEFIRLLQALVPLIAPSLIFGVCCYYLIRTKELDAILLSVGSGIGLLMTAFFTYIPYYIHARALSNNDMTYYYAAGGLISLFGTIAFAAGLFMVIDKVIKLTAKNNSEKNYF